jgi:CHAT domain-containing protein
MVAAMPAISATQTLGALPSSDSTQRNLQVGTAATKPAPPPSIQSLLIQLQPVALDDKAKAAIESRKDLLLRSMPSDLSTSDKIKVLSERANAAEELGDMQRRLADMKELAEMTKGTRDESLHLRNYGPVALLYGDLDDGIKAVERTIDLYKFAKGLEGDMVTAYSLAAHISLLRGNMQEALDQMVKAKENLYYITTRWTGTSAVWVPMFASTVFYAEGELQVAHGKWSEAETSFRKAVSQSEMTLHSLERMSQLAPNEQRTSGVTAAHNLKVVKLAEHLLRLGRPDEAELMLRELLSTNLRTVGRNSIRTATVLAQLADVMGARGRGSDGLQLFALADDILKTIGVGDASRVQLEQFRVKVNLHIGLQNWAAATETAEVVSLAFPSEMREMYASRMWSPGLGIALVKSGQALQAKERLQSLVGQRVAALGDAHISVAEDRGVLAMALATLGDKEASLTEFAKASVVLVDGAISYRETQPDHVQTLVHRLILEAYLDLLAENGGDPKAAETAFRIAEALNVGITQQAMAQSAARVASRQVGLGDLVRGDQDAQREAIALYGQLLRLAGLPAEEQLPKVMADMRLRIAAIDKARQNFQFVVEKRFPAYANLINPKAPSLAQTRTALAKNEALVSVFSTARATYVWSVRKEGSAVFTRVNVDANEISTMVTTLRKAVDPGDVNLANALPAVDLNSAYRLYELLLKPLSSSWRGVDSLLVVTNGALGHLPLGMLPTAIVAPVKEVGPRYSGNLQVPWLIRDFSVTQLPSVNALVTLRQLPAGDAGRRAFIGFGDPDFTDAAVAATAPATTLRNVALPKFATVRSGASANTNANSRQAAWLPYSALPQLPDTRDEILALASLLKADLQRDVFLGSQASRDVVKNTSLNRSRVLAFATHGLLPGEFPGVDQPALALANPRNGQNGLLTLDDILELKLDADWVILSACNTASGEGLGSEAVSGLGRGFFYAGTRALLATHWPVESASARLLVTGTIASQLDNPNLSRAQALRQSMLALMQQNSKEGFSYAHPLFWAPYALIGDGGIALK